MITSIEALFTLFQEPVKIVLFDAVKFAHLAFGLIPKILDSIDVVIPISKQFGMIDAPVMKVRYIQSIIGADA